MTQNIKQFYFNNLVFKAISLDDIDAIYDAFEETFESLNQYFSPAWAQFITLPSKKDMSKYWEECVGYFNNNQSFLFSVFEKENKKFIGHAEIHHYDSSVPKGRLGYWVRDSESGKGYATAIAKGLTHFGFHTLNCERLEIRNDVRNKASGAIAKKIGYKFLTVFEKNKQGQKGDFWDLEIHALLKDDYHDPS